MAMADAERYQPSTMADWHEWLAANHDRGEGVWVVLWKPRSAGSQLSYDELIREALCWGWVDGQASPLDEQRSMLWFTRRKPNSPWAATNKARVADLEREGRLQPAGIAEIERAKANGMWTVLDSVEALEEPAELAAALVPMHDTPLGPLAPGSTLRDIGLRDRLRELDFEFPLAGGDRRTAAPRITPTAVAMATDIAFTELHLHRMEICIRPENHASLRVVEKLGFRYEGLRRGVIHIHGDWRDHYAFALVREDVPEGVLQRWVQGRAPQDAAAIPPADRLHA